MSAAWITRLAMTLAVACASLIGPAPPAQAAEFTFLGRIGISVWQGYDEDFELLFGYDATAGSGFGSLTQGKFPAELFATGTDDRTPDAIFENWAGVLTFRYSGGDDAAWLSDQAELDRIKVTVKYYESGILSGIDTREFMLGGYVTARTGRTLTITPPLPDGAEWDAEKGEAIRVEFAQRAEADAAVSPAAQADPDTESGSFLQIVADATPGGAVVAQTMITVMVFGGFILKAPATPWGIILSAIVLIMTAWVPTMFGFGSTMAAAIILVNVLAGAFAYKTWAARTES